MEHMEYLLVKWPDVEDLMEYAWFRKECYVLKAFAGQEDYGGGYFVPKFRIEALAMEASGQYEQQD